MIRLVVDGRSSSAGGPRLGDEVLELRVYLARLAQSFGMYIMSRAPRFRVSDGQFILAKTDGERRIDQEKKVRERARDAKKSELKGNNTPQKSQSVFDYSQDSPRAELFRSIKDSVTNFFVEEISSEEKHIDKVHGLADTLSETKAGNGVCSFLIGLNSR